MNSKFLNRMDHMQKMIADGIKSVMIDHLIIEHNEAIGEIKAYKP